MANTGVTDVPASIRGYLRANMTAFADVEFSDEDNIFEQGFVSSMFAMQLLHYIESTFDVEVPDDGITLKNFSSVSRMADLVARLRTATGD
ncbi:phosphopantetheine attachment site family protein [Actinophytocola xinjiangensis]|uniref:Phosphopantetheine attachment site family protein n=1 Tax=Actinophytocola xinjiangensis TaxID=485602 RepID=A0A7Z0WLF0_9PSEU|nr:phosphopantetheine-binding protein [Actinophytocola xinjiangensis]OLF10155.1 phosphopantetheine attachment site family protein [Actinophytocola xinjiangensis]